MAFGLDISGLERHSSASFIYRRAGFGAPTILTNRFITNFRFSGVLRWQIPRKPRSVHVRTRKAASTMQACALWLVLILKRSRPKLMLATTKKLTLLSFRPSLL